MEITTEPPVDPALAVDRVLTAAERDLFRNSALVGPMQGAEPADWISTAFDSDAFLDRIEPWWQRHGDVMVDEIAAEYQLPRALAKSIVISALLACIAINAPIAVVTPVRDLAIRAALWTLGYMEAHPDPVRPPHRVAIHWEPGGKVHINVNGERIFGADLAYIGGGSTRTAVDVATKVGELLDAAVTTYGPAAAAETAELPPARDVEIRWVHDERVDVLVGDDVVITATHDEHGWDGISAVIDTATGMAQRLGTPVKTTGEANL